MTVRPSITWCHSRVFPSLDTSHVTDIGRPKLYSPAARYFPTMQAVCDSVRAMVAALDVTNPASLRRRR